MEQELKDKIARLRTARINQKNVLEHQISILDALIGDCESLIDLIGSNRGLWDGAE